MNDELDLSPAQLDALKEIGNIGAGNSATALSQVINRRIDMKSKELGYSLSEEYWGRGIMTEAGEAVLRYAFEELKLDVVSIVTTPDNKRSQRVIEKLGFTYEGTLREGQMTYNGIIKDTMCFSMLRREWEAAHPGAGRCEDGEER